MTVQITEILGRAVQGITQPYICRANDGNTFLGSTMKKIACQYAIVRFAPFIETGEFANVGIVMISPKKGFFGFNI